MGIIFNIIGVTMIAVSGTKIAISMFKAHKESIEEEVNCSGSPIQKPRKRYY
jgi:hypothetical protein